MINLFSALKKSSQYRKMEVSELLFVEYTCMMEESRRVEQMGYNGRFVFARLSINVP
jgi:hypothetical protein